MKPWRRIRIRGNRWIKWIMNRKQSVQESLIVHLTGLDALIKHMLNVWVWSQLFSLYCRRALWRNFDPRRYLTSNTSNSDQQFWKKKTGINLKLITTALFWEKKIKFWYFHIRFIFFTSNFWIFFCPKINVRFQQMKSQVKKYDTVFPIQPKKNQKMFSKKFNDDKNILS